MCRKKHQLAETAKRLATWLTLACYATDRVAVILYLLCLNKKAFKLSISSGALVFDSHHVGLFNRLQQRYLFGTYNNSHLVIIFKLEPGAKKPATASDVRQRDDPACTNELPVTTVVSERHSPAQFND